MLSNIYLPKWFRKLVVVLLLVELSRAGLELVDQIRFLLDHPTTQHCAQGEKANEAAELEDLQAIEEESQR